LVGLGYLLLGPMPYLGAMITNTVSAWVITIISMMTYGVGIAYGAVQLTPLFRAYTSARLRTMIEKGDEEIPSDAEEQLDVFISSFVSGLFNIFFSLPSIIAPIIGGFVYTHVPQRSEVNCIPKIENGVDMCVTGFQWMTLSLALSCFVVAVIALFGLRSPTAEQEDA
jgi:MFS family permease